ncbi:MAG: squalene synthase HpnC [Gammaproteobacteria bacterium]|uniref:squalene synthase HpnC n=1 Tax=Rhodoferax sp. TaxID=50421 RepID=UPI0017A648D8|nr:squalene synthase HpnC [Rhodoferax sp.]MBU3898738.1 squalene synthase HpnC [Gammaproteobacteria bacterium]MBA3057104.1 squalene synthase HpnC [Rhodoferax sp.]MBU3996572.1 squalene synthase HpnC [Gammaproteobacteria bacterium]MBU4017788.1 squalene synthase HpnC [Gammaproteobacteria bacterium]MBU4080722.1 squalene synthase HpnC [Gammaproteobacteria bacterium]
MQHAAPANPTAPPPIEHYENFPVASFFCPAHLRAPIAGIYHFARSADDLADEGDATAQQRLQALNDYRQQLNLACQPGPAADALTQGRDDANAVVGERWSSVFAPLRRTIQTWQLPVALLHDLLDAFVQDVEKTRDGSGYATQAELLDYCRRSANPIGRLLLHLYGVTDAKALSMSDDVCSALQLINFWQDPSRDLPRGRNYFAVDDCARFGVALADLQACQQNPAISNLIAAYAAAARARMLKGSELVHLIPGRAGWELRLVVQGGLRILDKIEGLHFATLSQRPTLKWWDAPVLLWRALWM